MNTNLTTKEINFTPIYSNQPQEIKLYLLLLVFVLPPCTKQICSTRDMSCSRVEQWWGEHYH
jgi:hypothetical protein